MNIAIIGFDVEGKSSYEFLAAQGHALTICDAKTDIAVPEGVSTQLGEEYLNDLGRFDRIVRTPGVHPAKILAANPGVADKITSHINLFFEHSPTKNIIGVTGTKGKGTTSTLITKILQADGKDTYLGGNIGVPPLSFIDKLTPESWVVLELSSFQLIDLRHSPHIAVCLMVQPEHLDWHEDFEEYLAAKQQLFINQTPDDIAIYYTDNENSLSIADASEGQQIPYFVDPGAEVSGKSITIDGHEICKTADIKLLGQHNWQNACAAVTAAWQVTQNTEAIRQVLTSFSGLPYRLELRREVAGIRYYNDSFATGQGATIAALAAIPEPKVMIIGGYDRILELDELAKAVQESRASIRKILLVGAAAERTAKELSSQGFDNFVVSKATTMTQIVAEATALAQSGDAVVLSPGFASFDMFKNFEDRGQQFNAAVADL